MVCFHKIQIFPQTKKPDRLTNLYATRLFQLSILSSSPGLLSLYIYLRYTSIGVYPFLCRIFFKTTFVDFVNIFPFNYTFFASENFSMLE